MTHLKPGMSVTVTISGRVEQVFGEDATRVVVAYGYDGDAVSVASDQPGVRVESDAAKPEHWPPQPGDVWHLFPTPFEDGSSTPWEAWHAVACRSYMQDTSSVEVQMIHATSPGSDWVSPVELLELGEMRLVYREPMPEEPAMSRDEVKAVLEEAFADQGQAGSVSHLTTRPWAGGA